MFKKDPQKKEQKRLNTALLEAAKTGKPADILQLLKDGAQLETKSSFWSNSQTPLGLAAWEGNTEAVRCLLEQGAQVNARDDAGDTPIRNATIRGNTLVIAILMEYGGDPAMTNGDGKSALSRAASDKRKDLIDIMTGRTTLAVLTGKPAATPAPVEAPSLHAEAPSAPAPLPPAPFPAPAPNADEVVFRRQLGNRTIEEVFNFAEKERVTLVYAGDNGLVEAITREDFSALQEKPSLRRAFEEYARRGGKIPESEIFTGELAKIKPLQRGPG